MKKFLLFSIAIFLFTGVANAQLFRRNQIEATAEYAVGRVPVVNGKVTFEETINVEGMSKEEIISRAKAWAN